MKRWLKVWLRCTRACTLAIAAMPTHCRYPLEPAVPAYAVEGQLCVVLVQLPMVAAQLHSFHSVRCRWLTADTGSTSLGRYTED
jgi:hypothetical protein